MKTCNDKLPMMCEIIPYTNSIIVLSVEGDNEFHKFYNNILLRLEFLVSKHHPKASQILQARQYWLVRIETEIMRKIQEGLVGKDLSPSISQCCKTPY